VSGSTTKPCTRSVSTSWAQTITRSAKLPLPIHFFCPSSTQLSPSRRAVVRSPRAASDPESGSVSPNAPISCIRAIAGSQRSFCSSEPQR
jgi:hypothetical protein